MKNITAKMFCAAVLKTDTSEDVRLYPVYSSDPAHPNHAWSQATPGGELRLFINNPSAFGAFEQGKEYLVEVKPAE